MARADHNTLRQRAQLALARRHYEEAHRLCMEMLQHNNHPADALFFLALIAADHNNFAKAVDVLDRAIRTSPRDPRFHAHRGRCLLALSRPDQANAAARRAAALKPEDPLTLDTVGVVLSRTGHHAEATRFYRQATALEPRNASYQYNLGAALQFTGEFSAARHAFEKALALDPTMVTAHSALSQLPGFDPEDQTIDTMASLFEQLSDADGRLHLGHALARALESRGSYSEALSWLQKAKAGKAETLSYDWSFDEALFDAAAAVTRRLARRIEAPVPSSGARPVFVVGMPRTGTTLVDRIISSHPSVTSAGELTQFALLTKRAAGTPSRFVLDAETLSKAAELDLPAVGDAYLRAVQAQLGDTSVFIDKMPLNFFYAPLILAALPHARILCLRRQPMDTCLSNYRQLFATGYSYYNYAYDLATTGRYFLEFDKLIATLRDTLPADRFTEANYDQLVSDQEKESRRIVTFCDLEWNDACLAFETNPAPVATASSVQVRQPIYTTASGRWRRYGDALNRLREVLEAGGVRVE